MTSVLVPGLRFFRRRSVRIQYQTETAECGLACLAMILGFFGKRTDLSSLRRIWPVSMKGLTLPQLIELAAELGLSPRALRLEPDALAKLRLPCLLHWHMDHFVVLESVRRREVTVLDPALGRRKYRMAEVSKRFSGVALELAPTDTFTRTRKVHALTLSRFFADTRGLVRPLLELLALSVALQLFILLTPFFSQLVIDDIVVSGDADLLRLAATSFIGLAVFIALSSAMRAWIIVYAGSMLNYGWSSALFEHLIRLPFDYFARRHVGDIQSRFGSLHAIRELITTQGVEAVIDGFMTVTTITVMYLYSPKLATVVIASVLLYSVIRVLLFAPLRSASLEVLMRNAVCDTYFLETLRGILAIRNFGSETQRKYGFESRTADSISAAADASRVAIGQDAANKLIFGVQNVVVIWVAAVAIIDGKLTAGMMVAFLAYKVHFVNRSAALVDRIFQFRLARIHLDRLEDIVGAAREDPGDRLPSGASATPALRGRIELRNIWYRYGRNEPYVLGGQSLTIEPGEQVAIAGPSGTGKSTLLKIMIGLIDPTTGDVIVDGRAIAEIGIYRYRRGIGVVMQNDQLLGGTLLDNICFFSPEPDIARIEACCRTAGIEEDIANMPMGLYTLVGDMGDVLSGGQKQRLLLARALYRQPAMLFLDEATSHLDADRESQLVRAISQLNITRVLIAHRAETLRHADRVISLA